MEAPVESYILGTFIIPRDLNRTVDALCFKAQAIAKEIETT